MTAETLIATILSHAYQKSEVHRHLWLLRTYLERRWFGTGDTGSLTAFYEREGASPRDRAVAEVLGDSVGGLSKDDLYRVFNEAEEAVKALPFIAVSIPFQPDDETVARIGAWFRSNVDKDIVLDITCDAGVVGGCAFALRGYLTEFALPRAIGKKKEEIRTMLRDYADKAGE
jgi:hypothetical protein